MSELPIACTLQLGELTARASELLPGVSRRATSCVPIDGGYRFEFSQKTDCVSAIAAVIDAERHCCRFLRFRLTVEPDFGPVFLAVTGPAGTEAFLSGLIVAE